MHRLHLFFLSLLLIVVFFGSAIAVENILWIDSFSAAVESNGVPKGWEELVFKKIPQHSTYRLENEDENYFIKAESDDAASGIIKKVFVDLNQYPHLKWRWKVSNLLKKGDATRKKGDDFSARIYITFEYEERKLGFLEKIQYKTYKLFYGEYPPQGAISYIWANKLSKGNMVDNAYTDKVKMVAVESGAEKLGEWIDEERNVAEDFKKLFGYDPPRISAIAIMTDSDNTKEKTEAYFDDIRFVGE